MFDLQLHLYILVQMQLPDCLSQTVLGILADSISNRSVLKAQYMTSANMMIVNIKSKDIDGLNDFKFSVCQ